MVLLNLALSQQIYLLGSRMLKNKALELIINSLEFTKSIQNGWVVRYNGNDMVGLL